MRRALLTFLNLSAIFAALGTNPHEVVDLSVESPTFSSYYGPRTVQDRLEVAKGSPSAEDLIAMAMVSTTPRSRRSRLACLGGSGQEESR